MPRRTVPIFSTLFKVDLIMPEVDIPQYVISCDLREDWKFYSVYTANTQRQRISPWWQFRFFRITTEKSGLPLRASEIGALLLISGRDATQSSMNASKVFATITWAVCGTTKTGSPCTATTRRWARGCSRLNPWYAPRIHSLFEKCSEVKGPTTLI